MIQDASERGSMSGITRSCRAAAVRTARSVPCPAWEAASKGGEKQYGYGPLATRTADSRATRSSFP